MLSGFSKYVRNIFYFILFFILRNIYIFNGKSLKDHLVRAKVPNVEITGRSESCGKGNCQVCDFICDTDTFSTKACGETFKIQSGVAVTLRSSFIS